jgi:hypothetical protein
MRQQILAEAQKAGTLRSKPKYSCSSTDYADTLPVDVSSMRQLATQFCTGDLTKARSQDMTNKDIKYTAYVGYNFIFSYSPGEGTCQ